LLRFVSRDFAISHDVGLTLRYERNIFWHVQETTPPRLIRPILFALFFVSGFCGLLYQVIWTRLAFASFGIITPVLSIVISVFMLGLAAGSWAGGKWIPVLTQRMRLSGAVFYALAELISGIGAFAVPQLFGLGNHILLAAGQMNSFTYLFFSACALAVAILPWCFFMGTTYPFMMAYIRECKEHDPQSFSFLYVANVLGAMSGTLLTAIVFIEVFGFHETLQIAAAGNFCIALTSGWLGLRQGAPASANGNAPATAAFSTADRTSVPFIRWILFSTGFCAMAMEVTWTRAFTPVLKTQVYSFALIVFTYLAATFAGSLLYRSHLKNKKPWPAGKLMAFLIVSVFLPIVINDPRWVRMAWYETMDPHSAILVLASICPFCGALGYLTPGLVDDYAEDDPKRAGTAYAINVAGCILGPLFASYILLPQMSERYALLLLGLPFFIFYFSGWKSLPPLPRMLSLAGAGMLTTSSLFFSHDFQHFVTGRAAHMEVRRDYAASVISVEDGEARKSLLVNGIGMTILTPVTKFMVHLPMAFHEGPPQSSLIICFGMGTSYRSALSWGVDTTAVELIPDVPNAFAFYHRDAPDVLRNPNGRIVIDDGRRFLARTTNQYDVIVVDPPPPVEAAGSSLLYSTGMYDLLKAHLKLHGIAQVWFPAGEKFTAQAVVRSAEVSFPYVRCFPPLPPGIGIHILVSMDPIEKKTPAQMAADMPESAKEDLLEWSPTTRDPAAYLDEVVSNEIPMDQILNPNPEVKITDDDPLNEYFLLRRMGLF
jgi:spermidine synthase